ncbi:RidA family protein [Virgibacillus halophilus]|uniref:RidA family protein n=1 Tax=Tigheibacillus halophilus TaxID=361280 RepID=A0ABU5C4S9_9BACI|nr:RidA family protein [Virgibacillus halophilus]
MFEKIYTDKAPNAIGPYSQAVKAGDFLYVSGQIGLNPETDEKAEGIEAQTKQVLDNLQAILNEAGADFSQVVKTTIYLHDMANFASVNEIYGTYFKEPYPARACIEAGRLPRDVYVEMDVVAYLK